MPHTTRRNEHSGRQQPGRQRWQVDDNNNRTERMLMLDNMYKCQTNIAESLEQMTAHMAKRNELTEKQN